ncbi:serine/threonine-protein kinase [Streptomyces sp. NPDC015171]|uniref:serine/threonine-protein kinase n=1 Tax=Streptomyces sp. NPDC015171 TaxID=3364945 RepID=UPI0036FBA3C7
MGPITGTEGVFRPLTAQEPRELAGYRLLARIGEGGMGSVYLSRTRGNQPVALKMIRREYADDSEFRRRFQHEVQAARRVRGYHLVPVVDHDTSGDQPWLASTYVPGVPLDEAVDRYGPLPAATALQLVACVARALDAVHAAGVVHRDLKPGNILLGADGPWVIDFGIARAAESTRLTRSGGFIGTPQFMSPEQGTGGEAGPAGDVFSLGLIAAVAATGRHPYGSGGALALATRIANTAQRPPDLSGYPDVLRPLLERCLTADPAARPAPAALAELCERASGRPSRDVAGWLPAPLAEAVEERSRAVRRLLAPEPAERDRPAAAYVPTRADHPLHHAPTEAAPSRPTAPPRAAAGHAERHSTVSRFRRGPAKRRPVYLAVGAAVLAAAVGTAWSVYGDTGHDTRTGAGDHPAQATASAGHGTAGGEKPSARARRNPPATAYEVLVKDRALTFGPPGTGQVITVDLDKPVVNPNGEIGDDAAEIQYIYQYLTFRTATAKSPGTAPETCRQSVDSAPLPAELPNDALDKGEALKKGDVLCTVTSEGDLAMLRLTDVVSSGSTSFDPPGYTALLTVWRKAAG